MNTALPNPRIANSDDVLPLGQSLSRAFIADPMMQCIFGDPKAQETAFTWFMTCGARYGLLWGQVYCAGAPATGGAVWLRPAESEMAPEKLAAAGFDEAPQQMGTEAFERFLKVMDHFQAVHARVAPEPHWYLMILGVDPDWQRRGLGGRLMQPIFAEADRAGLACYLETATAENVRFYQRHGFRIAEETIAPGGFTVWALRRECGAMPGGVRKPR